MRNATGLKFAEVTQQGTGRAHSARNPIANAKAGAAYVASKFGVTGLTQSINAEERHNGIRACAIFPTSR